MWSVIFMTCPFCCVIFFFIVNPGLARGLMTFLVAVTGHLTEGDRKRSIGFGLRFQGTPSTMAGKASRMTLCLQKSSAAASHGSQSRRQ